MEAHQLPEPTELLEAAVTVSLPLRTRFRGQTRREVMLLRGPAGWAEFGPFPEYGPEESAHWLQAALHAAWQGLGTPQREEIPINATVPAVGPAEVEPVLARYGDVDAIPAVKVKVAEPGDSTQDDLARVAEVHRLLPRAGIRVDANGAWTMTQAVDQLSRIAEIAGDRLEYAEQPVAGIEPLAELREQLHSRRMPILIAADEAVRKSDDPLRVAALGAADLIVVKVPPLGGVERALEVVARSGMPAVVSSALDTSIGLCAGLALAARLPELPYACGLGTVSLFPEEVVADPLVPSAGALRVPVVQSPGRGVVIRSPEPDPQLLRQHSVSAQRQAWWSGRLSAAYDVLHGS
ncbi:o-succinylbenzoate synthase [Nesterenkonia sphaerica]|uniref:o-succinylbenzoate synthase n=1 Tax=Nesterenkonia sphaerica TaxID=1804988 RepID=UPI001FB6134C|nr:o-succinylbenzoate synthase [Nesterenkonia sphaerica]